MSEYKKARLEYYQAPWCMVYDPELTDLDYRVFMMIITKQNREEYHKGVNGTYDLSEEWLAEMLNHPITDIVDSIGRLKKTGCLAIEDKNGHFDINWSRIASQHTNKANWKKLKEDKESEEDVIKKASEMLKKKGGRFASLGNELSLLFKEAIKDEELDKIFNAISI